MGNPGFIVMVAVAAVSLITVAAVILFVVAVRKRNLHLWFPAYCFPAERPKRRSDTQPIDVFIAICDHFEPERGGAAHETALGRVDRWCREYARLFGEFHDSRGHVPQHTFFFPQEEYRPEYLDRLAELCRAGYGDVEIHLHHDGDTPDGLRSKLESFRDILFRQHGLLRRDPDSGKIVYGFIHGNWALCNSRPDGRWCGVDNEIPILRETGCYADFTMPSAPDETQTRTINSIYYAVDQPARRKSHDTGIRARVGVDPTSDGLLMIQGPLTLDWRDRKLGMLPRIENAALLAERQATVARFRQWLKAGVHVAGKPDWVFIKLHTHGCKVGNLDSLLGPAMQQFHRNLAAYARSGQQLRYYYVTAWQMAQLVHQAERGLRSPEFVTGRCVSSTEIETEVEHLSRTPIPQKAVTAPKEDTTCRRLAWPGRS